MAKIPKKVKIAPKRVQITLTPQQRKQFLKDFKICPNSDVFFATYFSNPKHEDSLVNLINSVLSDVKYKPISRATVLNPFNIKKFAIDKNLILDVRAQDETGRMFDLEIQLTTHRAFKERMLGYWADTYSGQLLRGDKYSVLKPVVSILIVFDNLFPELENRHQVFHLVSDENPNVRFSDHISIHVLCLAGVRVEHPETIHNFNEDLQGWSLFFACAPEKLEEQMPAISKKNPVLTDVGKEFRRYASNPEMREYERTIRLSEMARRIELGAVMEQAAQAEARGRVEGRVEELATRVAKILDRRFDNVPYQLTEKLLMVTDLNQLDELFDLAFDCRTLEEFEDALGDVY